MRTQHFLIGCGLLIVSLTDAKAQNTIPVIGSKWIEKQACGNGSDPQCRKETTLLTTYAKDTVINGFELAILESKFHTKFQYFGAPNPGCTGETSTYERHFYRFSENKIERYDISDNNFTLAFDYDLSIGDTIQFAAQQVTVDSIDTDLVAGEMRKKIFIRELSENGFYELPNYFIQGLGSEWGLNNDYSNFNTFCTATAFCFEAPAQPTYQIFGNSADCQLVDGLNENMPQSSKQISQVINSDNVLQLSSNNNTLITSISVVSGFKTVYNKALNTNYHEIQLGDYSPGLLIVKVSSTGGIATFKILNR